MVKTFSLVALAAVAALLLGFGSQLGSSSTPKAHADSTAVVAIGCEFIVSAVDGNTTNAVTLEDIAAACGTTTVLNPNGVLPPVVPTGSPLTNQQSIQNLAKAIGDKDGVLTASDFSTIDGYDANQVPETCTTATPGLGCTLDVFAFVNNDAPVTVTLESGLSTMEAPTLTTFTCSEFPPTGTVAATPITSIVITQDNDCGGVASNGDGVVMFHAMDATVGGAARGSAKTANRVTQQGVDQPFTINVVGIPNNVSLTLAESTIETNGSTTAKADCQANTDVTDAIDPPTSTLAVAQVTDQDGRDLARVPLVWDIQPPSALDTIVALGVGNAPDAVTGNTVYTLDPGLTGVPIAAYRVVCGGRGTGTATVRARIAVGTAAEDTSTASITVGGAPSAIALTASPATIKCDGTETATVTAKVTDSAGNNVAVGVPVNFSVVALGTSNPINTTTDKDGSATTTVTPLSNSSAGVTVIVTAGSKQTSIRVDCSLPLVTQPTLVPPVVAPTARTGIGGPDTGNGGYLGQSDSSGFSMWTLVIIALGTVTLVAGGAVARRAGK